MPFLTFEVMLRDQHDLIKTKIMTMMKATLFSSKEGRHVTRYFVVYHRITGITCLRSHFNCIKCLDWVLGEFMLVRRLPHDPVTILSIFYMCEYVGEKVIAI
jgi:hypothetical protein